MQAHHTLLIDCCDRTGLVHHITGILFTQGVNVIENQEFVDREKRHFFMRTEFSGACERTEVLQALYAVLPPGSNVRLMAREPKRIVVLATREHHCLGDLLIRHAFNELNARILAVISNHLELLELVEKFGLPYHHVPHAGLTREVHEAQVEAILASYEVDYLVLAKYMRVLTPRLVERFKGRMINIHHSFLPAFIGANPYRQAYQRGVKIIGATAHFVTSDLDEGPIVAQEVIPVDHTHSAIEMAQAGRDVEKLVLARALKLVFEDRVVVYGNRTVVFE